MAEKVLVGMMLLLCLYRPVVRGLAMDQERERDATVTPERGQGANSEDTSVTPPLKFTVKSSSPAWACSARGPSSRGEDGWGHHHGCETSV